MGLGLDDITGLHRVRETQGWRRLRNPAPPDRDASMDHQLSTLVAFTVAGTAVLVGTHLLAGAGHAGLLWPWRSYQWRRVSPNC